MWFLRAHEEIVWIINVPLRIATGIQNCCLTVVWCMCCIAWSLFSSAVDSISSLFRIYIKLCIYIYAELVIDSWGFLSSKCKYNVHLILKHTEVVLFVNVSCESSLCSTKSGHISRLPLKSGSLCPRHCCKEVLLLSFRTRLLLFWEWGVLKSLSLLQISCSVPVHSCRNSV